MQGNRWEFEILMTEELVYLWTHICRNEWWYKVLEKQTGARSRWASGGIFQNWTWTFRGWKTI